MILAKHHTDHALLIRQERGRAHCSSCGQWINSGEHAWSYLANPVDGNYVEHGHCRYGYDEHSRLLRTPFALSWPKPIGTQLLSRPGEQDEDEDGTIRHTGPNAVGRVISTDYALQQGWIYGVVFEPSNVWVFIDEADFTRHPDAFEWLDKIQRGSR